MINKRAYAWSARLAALLVAAAVIPACSMLTGGGSGAPAGIRWNTRSTGPVVAGAPATNGVMWNSPNRAILGPIGIVGIGGVEVTYADADPANFGPSTANAAEGSHPVSTSRSLDPTGEAVINAAVQNKFIATVPIGQGQGVGVANQTPSLATGDQKMGDISRARAKHNALHVGVAAPDPGGLAQRLRWMKINPAFTNGRQWQVSGAGLTPAQAATQIAAAVTLVATKNEFGAAGYWTSGTENYYVFTMIDLDINAGAP